jgi:hypothetical protein
MRCSSCSAVVRPLVAIDIDGTLGDYHGHFQEFAEDYLGRDFAGDEYNGDVSHREYWESLAVPARTFRDMKLAYRQGAQKRLMPQFHGARELVEEIHKTGAEVWITTTRPYLRLDGVDPDTREWLLRNGIEYDGLLYDEDKYRVLAEQVEPSRVVAVLDDLPEQIEAAAWAFGADVPIWMRRASNAGSPGPAHPSIEPGEVRTLMEAAEVILDRIEQWNINQGKHEL